MGMKRPLTKEDILAYTISRDVDGWLQDNKDEVFRYPLAISRIGDITIVVRAAIQKANDFIEQHKDELAEDNGRHLEKAE